MKSTLHKFFLTLATVLLSVVSASAQGSTTLGSDGFPTNENDIKFFLSVTGYSELNCQGIQSTVYATVFDGDEDYNFEVVLPASSSIVCSDRATVRAMMRNVASLSVSTPRTHNVTVKTGTTVTGQTLGRWLPKVYGFESAVLPITVVDYNHNTTVTKEFTYTINGSETPDGGRRITGVRDDLQKAHDAWYLITGNGHVTTEQKTDDDTFIKLPERAYIQIGKERVTVGNGGVSVSEGTFDMNALRGLFQAPETVENAGEKAIIYLPKGTKLSIGASVATLNEDAKIIVDFVNIPNGVSVNGILSYLSNSTDNNDFIQRLLKTFDNLVYLVDKSQTVPVTVLFGEPPFIQVFKGKAEPETTLVTPEDFSTILQTVPNAVGYVWTDLNGENYATLENIAAVDESGVNNIVIDYNVGKNGHYYECNNLVLVDPTTMTGTQTNADFYTPEDFKALSLKYTRAGLRTGAKYFNSVCLPFEITPADVNGSIFTFANYNEDEAQVYFTNQTSGIEEGIPCIVNTNSTSWSIEKTNAWVVASPIKSTNMQGAFMESPYVQIGENAVNYALNVAEGEDHSRYSTVEGTCHPFRSYIFVDKTLTLGPTGSGSSTQAKHPNIIVDEATDITNINVTDNTISAIYSINGSKLNALQKGINILKMSNGSMRKVVIK